MKEYSHMTKSGTCHHHPHSEMKKSSGIFSTILLVLLPKCPFCIMAYSSTIMLCSSEETIVNTTKHTSPLTIGLVLFFCLITIISIGLNYRDERTRYALALAVTGSALTLFSVVSGGGEWVYYSGNLVLFFGIWLNGSMLYFFNKIKTLYKKSRPGKLTYP